MGIKSIQSNRYAIKDNLPQHLLELGFRRYYDEDEQYIYNFTVLRYEKTTVLRGRIIAYTDINEIKIDVVNNKNIPYLPFYNAEYGNYNTILCNINKNILAEFTKLGITKVNTKRKEKGKWKQ